MMADRRRRSPEASSSKRKESRRSEYDDTPRTGTGMRSGAESIYSSSSSSHEYIDISHSFPPNRSGLRTFFTAPSERRLRKRRSSRSLRHSNSSSDSLGDLAYGHGYLRRPKRKVRSRKGKEIDRDRYSERERERERYTEKTGERYSDREREKSAIGRATTDAEILAVGAGLAKLARDQNKLDLKSAARGGKQGFGVKEFSRRDNGTSRGLGPSKISHGSDVGDEDGWESASDAGSESSVDSRLAFGAESQGGWGFFGRKTYKPQSRKSSIVDPRLFGPENSLHGFVAQPVGFGEVSWNSSSDFGQRDSYTQGRAESVASGSLPPMQHVYPYATEDSTKFDAARSSVVSGPEPYVSSRPGPIPIQQPQPITPVSQSIYEPIYGTRSETGSGILKKTPSSSGGRSKSLAEAALFGVAGAAVGAAIASDRKDDRKERRREDDRDTREEDRTPKRRDSERKEAKDDRRRDKRDSPDRDDRKEKRREKDRTKASPDDRKDKKREKRRDDGREETRDERHERRREERRSERGDDRYDDRRSERSDDRHEVRRTNSETAVSQIPVDPFQYQVDNDAFATPNNEPATGHGIVQSVPTVFTVEREPDFSRKRSSSIKDQPVSSRSESGRKDYADWDEREQRTRGRDSRDEPLHKAEAIFEEERHFTAPLDAAAISAAIAAEGYRESRSERRRDERRGDRRSDYDDYDSKPRDKEPKRDSRDYDDYDRKPRDRESKRERERDPIQEEADRAYREIVMARKIASQVIRSRTPSPNRSVVDKYEEKEEEEIIRIVTPPGMDDHKKKGLYDAPNADFQLDHVLKDPQELRRFGVPLVSRDRSDSDAPYLKKDPDAVQPRPFLNLVLPTPSPSPLPEKQAARSEPAQPSKPQVETTTTAASDVDIGPKGNVVSSPSASTVSKGVTWGENETKHFEVESPSEHRDEFVSSPEIRARDDPVEQPKSSNGSKRSGWGAIAAGIIGAGAGAAAASSSETSKNSKSSKTQENEKKPDAPYEYRGVVVEPDSPPRSQRQRSPPTTGPKPTSSQTSQSSHIPGAFDDDLDFTATVAAGLQDTGFDPNIVINDPKFRRRDSPPGSNEPIYRAPYAETVSDLGSVMRDAPPTRDGQGFVIGEVATTPKDWPTVSPDEEDTPTKLSKKDQKKREKAAKRQSSDYTPLEESSKSKDIAEEPESYFETKLSKKEQKKRDKEARRQGNQADDVTPFDEPSVGTGIVEEPESYFDEPKKKSKKSRKGSSYEDDAEETSRETRKVSVPVDAFDDLRNGEDEWSEKKSKRKSKRDSERYDSPSRSAPPEIASPLERSSSLSKKSKDKSKRKSDQYEPDPTEVSLPPSTPSENSRDGDFEDPRRTRKSSNKDSADRGESRSVVSADASRYDDDDSRKSKRKSKSRDDFDDTRSVVSAPAGDDFEDAKGSKKKDKDKRSSGGFFGLFGSKSEVGTGARDDNPKRSKDDFEEVKKKSKKSTRNSMPDASDLYGDVGSQSVGDLSRITSNGNGNGNGVYHDDEDGDSRDESRKKSRTRDESTSSKKDSFLAKAGTLGAGVGLAGAAVAIAAQRHQQSNADNAHESNEMAEQTRSRGSSRSRQLEEILDPEITQRQFRPSIDPQYGDLLPLPPSDPVSPNVEPIDDLPDLPDSRPDTPEAERLPREKAMTSVRKSIQDTPMKSPSHSAVPLKFIMGNRSNPSSPGAVRPSPLQSPAATSQESLQFPRSRPRPTSWDSTKEYKPLYLVESNRRGSNVPQQEPEEPLPALPPSQRTSRSSSQLDSSDEATFEDAEQYPRDMQVRFAEPLSIDTGLIKSSAELLDSQQSTPKATVFQYLDADQTDEPLQEHRSIDDSPSLPTHRSVSPQLEERHDSYAKTAAEVVAGAALVSSIGYFASSPVHRPTDKSFLDELSSHSEVQRQPSPVDAMTKDRSSYLLQSSPMSRQTEEDDSVARDEQSPTTRQRPLQSDKDTLHSIRERDQDDIFEQSRESQPLIEQEREKTLDTLSGSSHDQSAVQEATRDLGYTSDVGKTLPELKPQPAATEAREEVEPVDEFFVTKSKKDKKKDKKKGKGLSRSSTQEEVSTLETSREPLEETPIFVEAEPTEDFSLPKSKKDKKKGKGLSRSSTQDDFSFEEPSREIIGEPSADVDPAEDFSTPKAKKEKKKDKKKGKSAMAWDPQEVPTSQTPEESFDTREVVPEEASTLDDFVPAESKKSKKDKKNRKSVTTWEPEETSSSAPIEEPAQDSSRHIPEEIAAPAALGALGVAAYQASKHSEEPSTSLQHEEEEKASEFAEQKPVNVFDFQEEGEPSEPTQDQPAIPPESKEDEQPSESIGDILPEAERDLQDTSTFDGFAPSTSKKSKKKKGKSVSSWEPEEDQAVPPPTIEEPEVMSEFVVPGSKKSKKKGKKSQSWTPEETLPSESVPEKTDFPVDTIGDSQPPIDFKSDEMPADRDFEEFVTFGSKKGKKKSNSKSRDPEPESQAQTQDESPVPDMGKTLQSENTETSSKPEVFDDFTEPSSEKGKKKSRKSQNWEEEPPSEGQPEISAEKSVEPDDLATTAETTSSGPTPIGGPGDWATAPSTPWATANEEGPKSPSTGYFPSAAALHSPQKRQASEESSDRSYFPSAAAVLPVAAAGAAILAADHFEKKPDDDNLPETSASRDLESEPSQPRTDSTRTVPDGLKAGYGNDQLSLARQLQDEFGARSKKSKKDKKKRPSLPATPDRDFSRSRDPNEDLDNRHRARSLSIGPSPSTERLGNRPMSENRKNVYSEDQLELARQLKEEFEDGNKKSKKDKKKRQGLSRTSTQDDSFLDKPAEEPRSIEPETIEDITSRDPAEGTGDGFDAGYKEDQLSLARQLQAEFGSGLKKSKKDKKRHSTSQTPAQEPESQNDYFGDTPQLPIEKLRDFETADTPGSSGVENDTVRDGLAVGYREDQLELARQLKEEFSSGSSKSKKGKKDKKRQSLLRNTTEDDFSSDYTPKDSNESRDIDPQSTEPVEAGPSEPAAAEFNDEFAFTTKKPKKDKKGKKRESLVPPTSDDIPSETIPRDLDEPRNADIQGGAIEGGPSDPTPAEPENEFTFATKKSKKDKKGKKRESLVPATIEPETPSETIAKDVDEPGNVEDDQPAAIEAESIDPPVENPEDEFDLTRKKSKKDKKGKKRDSVLRSTTDDTSSSDNFGNAVEALHNTRELPSTETGPIEEAGSTPADDDWAAPTKKSKKDKKKRQNPVTQDPWDQQAPEADSTQFPASDEASTADVTATSSAIEAGNEPLDDFGFSTNKSKKDKKKRQSLLRSSTIDDTPEPQREETNLAQESINRDLDDTTAPAPALEDVQDDGFEVASKKPKKDKKKRQVTQETSFADETPIEVEQPSSTPQAQPFAEDLGKDKQDPTVEADTHTPELTSREATLEHTDFDQKPAEIIEENPEAQFDNFAFATKKSKKDKKKRKDSTVPESDEPSGVSTPIDPIQEAPMAVAESIARENVVENTEVVEQPLSREVDDSIPVETTTQEALEDPKGEEWGSFSTKKSKKDKKKRKSGISTPIEEPTLEISTTSKDPVGVEEPKEISEQVADPVEEEWSSFATKKSKKDKKNRKSGPSTPADDTSLQAERISEDPIAVEDSKEAMPGQVQGPVDEEWGSFTTKKSKKDKKKSKSGLSTPLEETPPEPEPTTQRDLAEIVEPTLEEKREEPVDDEWGSFTTKKSKNGKQKSKSGLSTPLEETIDAPVATSEQEVAEPAAPGPEVQDTFAEPEFTPEKELSAAEEITIQPEEPVNDEWASFTAKKSKKDKKNNKSGLSTPLETLAEPGISTFPRDLPEAEEPKGQLEELMTGGVFTTKKSKKDKKDKSEFSTLQRDSAQPEAILQETQRSVEELEPQLQETLQQPESQESGAPQLQDTADAEWASFTAKKSKNGKKSKSGLSTPLEEPILSIKSEQTSQIERSEFDEPKLEALPTELDGPKSQPSFIEPETEITKNLQQGASSDQEVHDDAFDFVAKMSKKDKKKRKPGLSTPFEETLPILEPEESSRSQPIEFDESKSQPLPTEPEIETSKDLPQPVDNDQEATNDDFGFATKKSKKDKKKRKSGLSTPAEETLPTAEPAQSSRELAFDEPTAQHQSIEREVSGNGRDAWQVPAPEIADDGFEFASKKSKKDRKGKRASATPSASVPPSDIGPEDQAHLVSERFTQSPDPLEKDLPAEQTITEPNLTPTTQREAPIETQVDENDEFPVDLGRKPSKKDKRKRQATVANINDGPETLRAPLTSWADEVEEAEVEREVPVIEDIAKDESLSHIASTTEAAPVDDFSRPSKKGKKGKKRNSLLTRESSTNESFRPPIGEDALEKMPDEHSDIPILAATGAALAGVALLSRKSDEERTDTATSMNDPAAPMTKEADIPPPTRKLSKKEKRKQSIDRRTPKDDPFDDPALWEGAEPRSFEESKDANDDAGNDDFWSAPNRGEDVPTEELLHTREPPHGGPVDLFATSRTQDLTHERVPEDDNVHSGPPRDLSRPEQQWNDLPDEYITSSSKKDKKKQKAGRLAAWDTPQDSREIEHPSHPSPEPPRIVVEESHIEKHAPFEQRPSTPPNEVIEEAPVDRDLSFQDDQFRPRSSLRYSHHGASDLPVVREESPAQMESERFERPSYSHATDDVNRDSAFVTDSPIPGQRPFTDEHIRDSGVHLRDSSPAERAVAPVFNSDDAIARLSWPSVDETTDTVDLHRSQRPKVETLSREEAARAADVHRPHHQEEGRDLHRQYTPEEVRPKHHDEDRDFLPSQRHHEESHTELHRTKTVHRSHAPEEERRRHHSEDRDSLPSQRHEEASHTDLHRTKTIHQSQKPDSIVKQRVQRIESPDFHRPQTPKENKYGDLNTSQRPKAEKQRTASDNSTAAALAGATVGFAAARQASREQRPGSAQSQRSSSNINRLRTPDPKILRPESVGSNRSSGTPPLRRSDRKSGDLRSLSQRSNLDLAKEAELAAITAAAVTASTAATPANPQANEGRVRAKEMADVYDGFGEGRMGSPRSPTRPHSMRRRQSMQVLDLEQRLEQLAAENRALADAKAQADRALQTTQHASSALVERDAELDSLKRTLAWLQNEVTRLTEVNDGLTSANITLGHQHNDRYNSLESQHVQATRELQEVRDSHNNLSAGMEGIVRNEVQTAMQDKDREIAELRAQLEAAKEQIRAMQRQILESKANDGEFLTVRDEDYFDNACQQLCQHVQQWVLRFSKFSDMRACRLTSEINNDKIIDRLDNAILDGSDVDSYLADRVKRRDVFMSMTMTMVWEFVFTRYLFGMDREQRQKLKSLEKLLSEVGPASAVHQWRATTLTLLSKREAFVQQREQDTLAVVNAVLETLTEILPPPSHLEQQIQEQLTRVMKAAVDLSIEMRTQRAEYMMLPPLQPEYDANGDLASKVSFNAALMNERSGDTVSNEELEAQKAVVRIVLFPLVVKKGDDSGEGDEEIVVCPAQVLVAKPKKQVRIFSNGSQPNHSRVSMQSSMPADYGEGSVI